MSTQPKQNEKVKRLANDKTTTVVNHSQPSDDNKENQPANHQCTKPGIAGMVYKHINYFNVNYSSYFIYKGVKRKRCQTCTACVREDCGKCHFCLDKPKFGGKGKFKQCCYERRCKAKLEMNTKTTTTQIQSKVCILVMGEGGGVYKIFSVHMVISYPQTYTHIHPCTHTITC